jgi:hypothetical protein
MKNPVYFEIIRKIEEIETIATGGRIRDIMGLQRQFGPARWRKLKGIAMVRFSAGICVKPSCTDTKPIALVERK